MFLLYIPEYGAFTKPYQACRQVSKQRMSVATNAITLKGSAKIVAEFFAYGINSILYVAGIPALYLHPPCPRPPESPMRTALLLTALPAKMVDL